MLVALIAPYFIDWTQYRADFEREASAVLGRRVTVEGAAEARLLPFPSVTFSQVTVAGGPAGEPAMSIEKFSMDAELAPFLRGDFLIFDMRVERPRAVLRAAADGAIDWAVRPSSPIAANRISIEKLTVTDGEIEIRHALSGRTHLLSGINADISARSLAGPWRLDGSLLADGIETALSASTGALDAGGRMRVRVKATPAGYGFALDADGEIGKDEGKGLGYSGEFHFNEIKPKQTAKEDRAPPPPGYRLSGQFILDYKQLDVAAFRVETGPLDQPYTADGKAALTFGAEPHFSIEAKGAQIRLDEAVGAPQDADLSLDARIAAVEAAVTALPKPSIPGTVRIDLPAVLVGDTTIRDVKLFAEPETGGWAVTSLAATLPGRTTLEGDGFLRTDAGFGFNGSLLLAVAQPSGFAAWLANDIDDSIRKLPAAGFRADVEIDARRQTFRAIELVLGGAKFRGEIDLRQPEGLRPSLSVALEGGALDAEGLSALKSLFLSERGVNRFAGGSLDLKVKAGPVTAAGFVAGTVDAALRLDDGRVDIDRLTIGGLEGASVSATGTLTDFPANPLGSIDASVVAVDLAPLMAKAGSSFPDNAVLRQVQRRVAGRAGLLADAKLDLVVSAETDDSGVSLARFDLKGSAGGTILALSSSMKGDVRDWRKSPVTLSASAANEDAGAVLALAGLQTLPLAVVGEGKMSLSAQGALANGLPTKLVFEAEGLSAAFDGVTGLGDDGLTAKGKTSLSAQDIQPWLMTVGVALPGLGTGMPVDLTAQADYGAKLLVLEDIDGALNETAVAGDLNAEIDRSLPRFTGALVVDDLTLDPLAAIVLGEASLVGDPGEWASAPFSQKRSLPFAADVDVSAGTLSAGSVTAYDATLSLRSDEAGLRVDDLKATYDGGTLAGRFDLKNNGGTGLLSAQVQIRGADLAREPVLAALTGRGDLSVTFSGSGKSVGAVVTALSGSGSVAVRGLGIEGINAAGLPEILDRADAQGRDIDAARTGAFAENVAAKGSMAGGDAGAAFTIAGGVARAPSATLGDDRAKLTAEIQLDLVTATIETTGTLTYAAGDEALTGSEPALRYALAGPLGETRLSFDSAPLAQFLTQRALEREQRRVEAMQAVLLEKQRLRREVRYYASLEAERIRIADEERKAAEEAREKAAQEARLQAEAEERRQAEARQAAEAAAQRALEAAAEARREAEETERRLNESTPEQMTPPTPRAEISQ